MFSNESRGTGGGGEFKATMLKILLKLSLCNLWSDNLRTLSTKLKAIAFFYVGGGDSNKNLIYYVNR